jgi:hypothetical protein
VAGARAPASVLIRVQGAGLAFAGFGGRREGTAGRGSGRDETMCLNGLCQCLRVWARFGIRRVSCTASGVKCEKAARIDPCGKGQRDSPVDPRRRIPFVAKFIDTHTTC